MKKQTIGFIVILMLAFSLSIALATTAAGSQTEVLGKALYFDQNLSSGKNQSCASCHLPTAGFADPDSGLPVSEGSVAGRFGTRNSPTSAYASFSPVFHLDSIKGYIGGQFWDGRASTLKAQAKGPFTNPVEMNCGNEQEVVSKVLASTYRDQFISVYGTNVLTDYVYAYDCIADAIATYESSAEVNRFSSKYDRYLAGTATLTAQEKQGLSLFNGKARCSKCHLSSGSKPLFTDFSYHNLGVPKNTRYPFNILNPGKDYGLGGVLNQPAQWGKFKVPTLRNIAKTAPYTHNGYFVSLNEIVRFYNKRDKCGCGGGMGKGMGMGMGMYQPEVAENINRTDVGNLGLTCNEENAVVAFLKTLTDE